MTKWELRVEYPNGGRKEFWKVNMDKLCGRSGITVGRREGAWADVLLDGSEVSQRHFSLHGTPTGENLQIQDLKSRNGTYLLDDSKCKRLLPQSLTRLQSNQPILLRVESGDLVVITLVDTDPPVKKKPITLVDTDLPAKTRIHQRTRPTGGTNAKQEPPLQPPPPQQPSQNGLTLWEISCFLGGQKVASALFTLQMVLQRPDGIMVGKKQSLPVVFDVRGVADEHFRIYERGGHLFLQLVAQNHGDKARLGGNPLKGPAQLITHSELELSDELSFSFRLFVMPT